MGGLIEKYDREGASHMIPTDRFSLSEAQRHKWMQPECPVLVYSYRCCKEKRSGAVFAQLRMVNRTERTIRSVSLRVEGLDRFDETVYTLRELLLPACGAGPHTIFGEERLLLLDREAVYGLRVTVQRVLFEDGMLWRRLPEQALCPAADAAWPCCSCGMPNPPDAEVCALCGRELPRAASPVESAADAQPDDQSLPARTADDEAGAEPRFGAPSVPSMTERPAPIVRERPERIVRDGFPSFDVSEEEEPDASPRWLVVLTIIICTAAVLVAAGVLLYYLRDRLPM